MPNKLSTKKRTFDWWDMTPKQRFDAKLPINEDSFRETLTILPVTFKKWKAEYKALKEVETLEAQLKTSDGDTKTKILDKLAELCLEDGVHRAGEVWLRETKETGEKEKVELTADEIAEQYIRNRKWLREHGYLEAK